MKITVFGATGDAGKMVVQKALEKGYFVTAYVRNASKISISHPNLNVVTGKLAEPDTIDHAVKNADCVISLLGPTSKTRGLVIAEATKCIVRSMERHGVNRLIATSTPCFSAAEDRFQFSFALGVLYMKYFLPDSFNNMRETGKLISVSNLDWTLVRLALLSEKPATGNMQAGFLGNGKIRLKWLSRHDLAQFLLTQIDDKKWIRKAPMVSR